MMPNAKRSSKPRPRAHNGSSPELSKLRADVRDLFRMVADNMEEIQKLSVIAAEHKAELKKRRSPRAVRSQRP